jgi:hypothetical protein
MSKTAVREQITHRWYTRPVLFVAELNRALRFYIDMLGFEKRWHEGDGAGKVCQVNRAECEIIVPTRKCYPVRMRLKSATYKKPKMEASLVRRLECNNVTLRRSRWTEFLRITGGRS